MYQTLWINKGQPRVEFISPWFLGVTVHDPSLAASLQPGAEHGAASSSSRLQAQAPHLPLLQSSVPKPQQPGISHVCSCGFRAHTALLRRRQPISHHARQLRRHSYHDSAHCLGDGARATAGFLPGRPCPGVQRDDRCHGGVAAPSRGVVAARVCN